MNISPRERRLVVLTGAIVGAVVQHERNKHHR